MTELGVLHSAVMRARYSSWTPRAVPERPKPKPPVLDTWRIQEAKRVAERKARLDAAIAKAKAMFPPIPKREFPEVAKIRKVVADHYGFGVNELVSPRRFGDLTHARHVAFYLCKTLTEQSFPAIGRLFGDRDHTTILVAVRKMTARLKTDEHLRQTIDALAAKIKGDPASEGGQ